MKDVKKKLLMKMLNDVPSGTKKKIQFLQWEKNINENDEGRAMKFLCKKKIKTKVMKDVPQGQERKMGFYW